MYRIVSLCPNMVAAENKKFEGQIHEACRQGNDKVLVLLEINPWVASQLNCNNHSALLVASNNGHLNVVELLLAHRRLVEEEDGGDISALIVAASKGHSGMEAFDSCDPKVI
ncbi:hypothetical protein Acr_23g0001620 [Actinidia rufa]|uniref:Ankyrin repeat family protein n=1 Tax=Actinidia rufa TaxID=165716 RepID=A0A7J0GLS4_9ERIC|nr:hypothetical protein Acr_23g0001620 [Actinidia rufa]